jgi:hypothetical protein
MLQFAAIRRKTLQKHRKTRKNAAKRRKMLQFAAIRRKTLQKHRKTRKMMR